jgi:hypothetical protein
VDIHKQALANSGCSRGPESLGNTFKRVGSKGSAGSISISISDTFERVGSNGSLGNTFERVGSNGSAGSILAAEATSASTESNWRETDDYNVRQGCNIFENRITTEIIEGFLRRPKKNQTRIVDVVSNILDEDPEWNIGKAIGEETYLALLIGDWLRAFEGIKVTFGYMDVSKPLLIFSLILF